MSKSDWIVGAMWVAVAVGLLWRIQALEARVVALESAGVEAHPPPPSAGDWSPENDAAIRYEEWQRVDGRPSK